MKFSISIASVGWHSIYEMTIKIWTTTKIGNLVVPVLVQSSLNAFFIELFSILFVWLYLSQTLTANILSNFNAITPYSSRVHKQLLFNKNKHILTSGGVSTQVSESVNHPNNSIDQYNACVIQVCDGLCRYFGHKKFKCFTLI